MISSLLIIIAGDNKTDYMLLSALFGQKKYNCILINVEWDV